MVEGYLKMLGMFVNFILCVVFQVAWVWVEAT